MSSKVIADIKNVRIKALKWLSNRVHEGKSFVGPSVLPQDLDWFLALQEFNAYLVIEWMNDVLTSTLESQLPSLLAVWLRDYSLTFLNQLSSY